MKFFSRYNPPKSPGIEFDPEEKMTRDEFAEECDIHNILKKFKVTGVLVDPAIRRLQQPMFGDFTEIPSLDEFEKLKIEVGESFEKLPDAVREAFHGDPIIAMSWLGKATPRQIVGLWRDLGLDPKTGEPFKPAPAAGNPAAGNPAAGISAAGISAAGISAAGISAAGISAAGISAAGISAAGK